MTQIDWDENRTPTAVPAPENERKESRKPVSIPSTDYPMELSESDIALMKQIVARYRGVYDYLADR